LTHRYAYRSIRFSWDWEHAWNTHDIEAMLAHFSDEVFFTSPVLAEFFPNPVERCGARPAYATTGRLRCNGFDLHFTVVGVYAGIDVSSSTTGTRSECWSTKCSGSEPVWWSLSAIRQDQDVGNWRRGRVHTPPGRVPAHRSRDVIERRRSARRMGWDSRDNGCRGVRHPGPRPHVSSRCFQRYSSTSVAHRHELRDHQTHESAEKPARVHPAPLTLGAELALTTSNAMPWP
jgi:hypothetical protein